MHEYAPDFRAINFYVCRRMQRLKANIAREEGLKLLHETVNKAFFSTSLTNAHFGAAIHLISTANHILGQGASNNAIRLPRIILVSQRLVVSCSSIRKIFGEREHIGCQHMWCDQIAGRVKLPAPVVNNVKNDVYCCSLSTYVIRPNSEASETSGSSP
uniref:Uncharacterized protein n=1 Tax=Ditylenchus dipsaci TaxID=166011 RepID=A0A915E0I8_9BILA